MMKLTKSFSRTGRSSSKGNDSNKINAQALNQPASRRTTIQTTATRMTQPIVPAVTLTRSDSQASSSTTSSQSTLVHCDSESSSVSSKTAAAKRVMFDDETQGTIYKSLTSPTAQGLDPTTGHRPTASAQPLSAIPPLPTDLSSLSRQQLENLVHTLHQETLSTRVHIQEARALESTHKVDMDKVAKRAFKSIVNLREQVAGYERELAKTRAQLADMTDKFDQVMAVLMSVVPGMREDVNGPASSGKETDGGGVGSVGV